MGDAGERRGLAVQIGMGSVERGMEIGGDAAGYLRG